ncbi:hypothetical protein EMIT0111MI5_150127 [Burkholderia sp. IT-111MI5]
MRNACHALGWCTQCTTPIQFETICFNAPGMLGHTPNISRNSNLSIQKESYYAISADIYLPLS